MRNVRCSGHPWEGVCPDGGLPANKGCLSAMGVVCLPGGLGLRCLPDPSLERMTDTCKNITLPQLHCAL